MTDEDLQMTDEDQAMLFEALPDNEVSGGAVEDGLVEIYVGTLFLTIGGGSLLGVSMTAIWLFMIAFGVFVVTRLKENITYPRVGRPTSRVFYSKIMRDFIILFMILMVLLGVGLLALNVADPTVFTTVGDNIALLLGVMIAIIYGFLGFRWKVRQYKLFAGVGIVAAVIIRILFPDPSSQLLFYIAVMGITMLGTGVLMLQQFQQKYPITGK